MVIEEVGIECADGSKFVKFRSEPPYDDALPTEVPSGHSVRYGFPLEQLLSEQVAKPVTVYCRDATGNRYRAPFFSR